MADEPLWPEFAAAALAQVRPPATPFDPQRYELRYRLWPTKARNAQQAARRASAGYLLLRREPLADGARLQVRQAAVQFSRETCHVAASLELANDALATPRRWEVESWMTAADGRETPLTRASESGELTADAWIRRAAGERRQPRAAQVTCGWSLFDALPRLTAAELRFDLLDELALLKPGHRLSPRGAATFKLASGPGALTWWEQLGPGLLPYSWWRAAEGPVLAAFSLARGFLLDPRAGEGVTW
ncbi:MAG: hypothetical protein IT204_25795 [Fimbriimonadaceae bacterium]|nr:hypothetical protein [Fimbriimonadaceae bacterium]